MQLSNPVLQTAAAVGTSTHVNTTHVVMVGNVSEAVGKGTHAHAPVDGGIHIATLLYAVSVPQVLISVPNSWGIEIKNGLNKLVKVVE